MQRKTHFGVGWIVLTLFLVLAGSVQIPTVRADSGWQAAYWNNTSLSGPPALQRPEFDDNHNPDLDINWDRESPHTSINNDYFSARWTRSEFFQPGRYRFTATADDGVRVWVNGRLLIDAWLNQPATTHVAYIDLSAGVAPIRVEYYDNQHHALVRLAWSRVPGSDVYLEGEAWQPAVAGWRGEYYDNMFFAGPPNLVRDDAAINFDWGLDSPAIHVIHHNRFAVRWSNTLSLEPGRYRFAATTDDGVRLWVNDQLVIDQWHAQTAYTHAAELDLPGGATPVKMEYYDEVGLAEARLAWTRLDVDASLHPDAAHIPVEVTLGDSAPGPEIEPVATVSNANVLNVRAGPGLAYESFAYLVREQTVTMLGRDAAPAWIQVQLPDGRSGWVGAGYLTTPFPLIDLAVTAPN